MAITSSNERIRREAKYESDMLKAKILALKIPFEEVGEWIGCTGANVSIIFKSRGIKYWQARAIEMHLEEIKKRELNL